MKIRLGFLILLFLLILFPVSLFASTWAKTYGGSDWDYAESIQQTSDDGFIVAGTTRSYGVNTHDIWVLKLDASGKVTWQRTYHGLYAEIADSVQQTSDGGFIVAGYTSSYGAGDWDFWLLKLNSSGNVTWHKTYGGSSYDEARSIQQTSDGGFIVAGDTSSYGAGNYDFWVLKLNSTGNVTWQKTYGGTNYEHVHSVQQTSDGGFIVAGDTFSYGAGNYDIWVLKLNASGNVTWQKTYGGSGIEYASSIQQTSDGGFIVAGLTQSYGAGNYDIWVLKLNSTGNVTWQKTYGGPRYDHANSIQQTSDGGFIVGGLTQSYGAGYDDIWVLKLDASGNIPGCDLIGEVWAWGNNTGVIPTTTGAITEDTNAILTSPSIIPTFTNATADEQCFDEGPSAPPTPASINYPSSDNDGNFTVSWSSSSEATNYTLQRATNASFTGPYTVYGGSSTSYNQTGLVDGTYYYRVSASNVYGSSGWRNGGPIVVGSALFQDVPPDHWAYDAIYKIYAAGITEGCSQNPLMYCPDKRVYKAAMAVFILRSLHGGNYTPPTATGNIFTDVNGNEWYAPWVEQLYKEGITTGCSESPLMYCPDRDVSKASMAVFLLRSLHGASYIPPTATGNIFTDVNGNEWYAPWVEQLYKEGITTGCSESPLMYCPNRVVSRAAMALFLVRTFGL